MLNSEQKQSLLDARMRRGEEAERLLSNPLMKQAIDSMEREIIGTMKALKPNDAEGRDVCWRELRALERFYHKFRGYVQIGEQAKKSLMQKIREKI